MTEVGYRLEWRLPEEPGRCQRGVRAFLSDRRQAIAIMAAERSAMARGGEFRLTRQDGGACDLVYTREREIARWAGGGGLLPTSNPRSEWLEGVRRAARATRARLDIRSAVVEALAIGAVDEAAVDELLGALDERLSAVERASALLGPD